MSATVTIDRDSPPGSYRAALDPERAHCAVCRQRLCSHTDAEYQGIIPPIAERERAQ